MSAETFVRNVYFITDEFDVRFDLLLPRPLSILRGHVAFLWCAWRYRCLFVYFHGGPLGFQPLLQWMEPSLLRLAGLRTVVMPYGGDVQDMSRSPNLLFKHSLAADYPEHMRRRRRIARKIDLWVEHADHVVSGCEWVDYLHHWDTLMLAHFSIDLDEIPTPLPPLESDPDRPLRILHAPNHRTIKGTQCFIDAVEELRTEGLAIELTILEGVPNAEVRAAIASADVVADQLVAGWYAMFAIEGMAYGRAVLCFLRDDLRHLYEATGLVKAGEIPILNCRPGTVAETIRRLHDDRRLLAEMAARGPEYVARHHGIEEVGRVFVGICRGIGL